MQNETNKRNDHKKVSMSIKDCHCTCLLHCCTLFYHSLVLLGAPPLPASWAAWTSIALNLEADLAPWPCTGLWVQSLENELLPISWCLFQSAQQQFFCWIDFCSTNTRPGQDWPRLAPFLHSCFASFGVRSHQHFPSYYVIQDAAKRPNVDTRGQTLPQILLRGIP